jgi:hypothetical protein
MLMKTKLLPMLIAAAALAGTTPASAQFFPNLGFPGAPGGLAQAEGCLGPDAARVEVQNGAAQPFSRFRGQVAAQTGGEVLSADLCRSNGRLVYQVSVLVGGRQVVNLTVDAQSGTIL